MSGVNWLQFYWNAWICSITVILLVSEDNFTLSVIHEMESLPSSINLLGRLRVLSVE